MMMITSQVLIYTAGHINYGGRVTDDWDRRCMMNVLSDYYNDNVIKVAHQYDASGVYKQLDPSTDLEVIVTLYHCAICSVCRWLVSQTMFTGTL